MTFLPTEQSIQDAEPIELYEFIGPSTAYRFTSSGRRTTVGFMGNTYTSIPIQRSAFGNNSTLDFPEITVDIPIDQQIVKDYAFNTPPETLDLTIYRLHGVGGPSITLWQGFIDGITVQGDIASFKLTFRLDNALDLTVPRIKYQSPCNHRLFDTQCSLSEPAFTFNTTVVSVDDVTVVVTSVDSNPDQFYQNGGIVNTATGERKLVIEQVGTTFTLISPFRALAATNAIGLVAGCDRSRLTCINKFNNIANYGGFPDINISNNIFINNLARFLEIGE